MDLDKIPFAAAGLTPVSRTGFEVSLPMTREAFIRFALSETDVPDLVEAAAWCASLITEPLDVVFAADLAVYQVR